MARMKPPIIPEQPVPVVPEDGLRRLLAVCAGKDFEARRDTAIITLLLDTGARSGEFAGLTLSDVDFDLDVLLVLGKGRRERALPFGRTAALALDATCGRARPSPASPPRLAVAREEGGTDGLGLSQMLERRGNQAGLPNPAPPPTAAYLRPPVARRRRWRAPRG